MNMRFIILSFISVCLFTVCQANDSLVLYKTFPIKASLFTTDLTGNCYIVKENNTLLKLNNKGDSIGVFNEIRKGKIKQVDATNPFRVLLYYADFNQVVILDNMLSKKNILKLNTIGIFNAVCIANSIDGNIWVYDGASSSLMKLNDNLEISTNTNLRNILTETIEPVYMVEQERNLLIVDSVQGIYKFDLYGFYNTTYHFKTNEIQYFNNYLVYYQQPNLVSYQTQSLIEKKIILPKEADIKQVRIERNKIYILRENSFDMYNFIQD